MTVGTTRSKRRLGRFLRPFLEQSSLKVEQLAEQARCSRQTASRLFSGDHLPRYHLFTTLLAELGVTGEDRDRALELWEIADSDAVSIHYAGEMPPIYQRFRLEEREATRERTLDPTLVPGLLQTASYARAVTLANRRRWRGDWNEDATVVDRRDRWALLTRVGQPLVLHALLDEVALRRTVGGWDVMSEQLTHLVEMGRLPNITIQVVPFAVGAYGAHTGAVVLLDFAEEDEQDTAYAESTRGLLTVDKDEDVDTLSAVWNDVAAMALSVEESADLIQTVKAEGS